MKYGIVLDSIFARHNTPAGHPERPQRIEAIIEAVERWNLSGQLVRVMPLPAQEEWILAVHTCEHWQKIQGTSGQAVSQLNPDTYTGPDSFETATLAAGSAVALTRKNRLRIRPGPAARPSC